MKLGTFDDMNVVIRRIYTVCLLVLLLFFPLSATPAAATESDKWYMKPFEWMIGAFFEYILEPFMGIHEPAYYIFYQGDGLIWGLYTEDQFNLAIKNGFNMMLFVVSFMVVTAIIKMAVQHSYGKFSPSMKVDMFENGLKILIGLILIFQFFSIVNVFFTMNMYGVSMFEQGIEDPTSLTDLGAEILTSADGTKTPGDEISFTDLDNESDNPIKNAIVSFFSLGVSIWFKAYYIQRTFIISGLIILAPIWISTMFFPKLQGITGYAFKEVWAQTMAQTIHAAVFFLYFWLFDGSQDWFTYIIALSFFIPVSESIRFTMGATSNNAGRLAMIGTLAGAGSLMHMGKAFGDVKNGFKNAFIERKGGFDGPQSSGGSPTNGSGSMASINTGGLNAGTSNRQYGGAVNLSSSPNRFARNMRSFGHVASGVGSAIMRTGGYSAGMAINPIAGHLAAEGGADVGQRAGYGAGVLSYAGAKGIKGKAVNAVQGFKDSYQSSINQGRSGIKATVSGIGAGIKEGTVSSDFRNSAIRRNEIAQKVGGAMGEASFGRGVGYHMGAETATKYAFSGMDNQDIGNLKTNKTYAVVTTDKGSYFAEKKGNNHFVPISNTQAGDPSLSKGSMVVQEYKVNDNADGIRRFEPSSHQYAIKPKNEGGQWTKVKVEQPTNMPNPYNFMDTSVQKPNPIPYTKNPKPSPNPIQNPKPSNKPLKPKK